LLVALFIALGMVRDAHALWNLAPTALPLGSPTAQLAGGRMSSVVFDPDPSNPDYPNYAVASSETGGIYVSLDGGLTWSSNKHDDGSRGDFGLGFEGGLGGALFDRLAVNADGSVFLALVNDDHLVDVTQTQSGLWRSTDKGRTWRRASGNPAPLPNRIGDWGAIAFSSTTKNAYATAGNQLGISTDGAADSWTWLDPLAAHAEFLTGLAVSCSASAFGDDTPSDELAFCLAPAPTGGAASPQQLALYDVRAKVMLTFDLPPPAPGAPVPSVDCSLAFDPNNGLHIFLARQFGEKLYEGDIDPESGTITWNDLQLPPFCLPPIQPGPDCVNALKAGEHVQNGRQVFVQAHKTSLGVALFAHDTANLYVHTVQGGGCPAVAIPWTESHYDAETNPNFPRRPTRIWADGVLWTDGFDGDRAYVYDDFDNSIWSFRDGAVLRKETGLTTLALGGPVTPSRARSVTSVAFDPTNHDRIAVGTGAHGVLVSTDAGESWAQSFDNVPQPTGPVTGLFVYPGLGAPSSMGGHCVSYAPNQLAPDCEDAYVASWGQGLWAIKLTARTRLHLKPKAARSFALAGSLVDASGAPISGASVRVQILDKSVMTALGVQAAQTIGVDDNDDPGAEGGNLVEGPPPNAVLMDYQLQNATDGSGQFDVDPPALSPGNYYVLVTNGGDGAPLATAGIDYDVQSSCVAANGPCFGTPGAWTSKDATLAAGVGPGALAGAILQVGLPGGKSSYTLTSANFGTTGLTTGNTLQFDLLDPPNPPNPFWLGDVQAYISIPSASIYHQWIGIVLLSTKPLGAFETLSFPIPPATVSALSGIHNDVSVSLQFDVASGSGPYYLQNFRFGH
jgi:hypothetical protein